MAPNAERQDTGKTVQESSTEQKAIKNLQKRLENANRKINALEKKMKQSESDSRKKVEDCRKNETRNRKAIVASKEEEINKIKTKYKKMEETNKKTKKENFDLRNELKSMQNKFKCDEASKLRNERLQKKCKENKSQVIKCKQEISNKNLETPICQNDTPLTDRNSLEQENIILKRKVAELEKEKHALREELERECSVSLRTRELKEDREKDYFALKHIFSQQHEAQKELVQEKDKVERAKESYEREIIALQKKVGKLEIMLQNIQSENINGKGRDVGMNQERVEITHPETAFFYFNQYNRVQHETFPKENEILQSRIKELMKLLLHETAKVKCVEEKLFESRLKTKSMETKLEDLTANNRSLAKTRKELENIIGDLRTERDVYIQENQKLNRDLRHNIDSSSKLEELKSQNLMSEKELDKLRKEKCFLDNEIERLYTDLEEARCNLKKLEDKQNNLVIQSNQKIGIEDKEIKSFKKIFEEHQEMKRGNFKLQTDVQLKEKENEMLKENLSAEKWKSLQNKEKIETLTKEIEHFKVQGDCMRKQIANLNAELVCKEEILKNKEEELRNAPSSSIEQSEKQSLAIAGLKKRLEDQEESVQLVHKLQHEVVELQLEKQTLIENLRTVKQECIKTEAYKKSAFTEQIETLEKKCEHILTENMKLRGDLRHEREILDRKENELRDMRLQTAEKIVNQGNEIADLKIKLKAQQELEQVNLQLRQEVEKLYNIQKKLTEDADSQNTTSRENFERDKCVLEQKIDSLKEKSVQLQNENSQLREDLAREKEQLRINEHEFEKRDIDTQRHLKVLEEELKKERYELQCRPALQDTLSSLEHSVGQLTKEKQMLTENLCNETKRASKLEMKVDELQRENSQLIKEISQQEKILQKLQKGYADKFADMENALSKQCEEIDDLKSIEIQLKRLNEDYTKLQTDLDDHRLKNEVLEEQISCEEKSRRDEKHVNVTLKGENERLENKLKELSALFTKETEQFTERLRVQTEKSLKQDNKLHQLQDEKTNLRKELINEKENLKKLHNEFAAKAIDKEKLLTDRNKEIDRLKFSESEFQLLKEKYAKIQAEVSSLRLEKKRLEEKISYGEHSQAEEQQNSARLIEENKKLRHNLNELSSDFKPDTDLKHLKQQCADLKEQLRNAQTEVDETKSRLSRAMGDKLTDNNPNIADLSDKNRPTKISERYQELYDNQWTDAFEVVDKTFDNEELTIKVLKDILTDTRDFCKTEAFKQIEDLEKVLSKGKEVPSNILKQLKDSRKALAESYGKELFLDYETQLRRQQSDYAKMASKVPDFLKECFQICWLMAVQDPPVVLGPDISKGSAFNRDHYKAYTKCGDRVIYIVWPVLLLHENGPVLCKGVAQG